MPLLLEVLSSIGIRALPRSIVPTIDIVVHGFPIVGPETVDCVKEIRTFIGLQFRSSRWLVEPKEGRKAGSRVFYIPQDYCLEVEKCLRDGFFFLGQRLRAVRYDPNRRKREKP
jgi:hypothetical protein